MERSITGLSVTDSAEDIQPNWSELTGVNFRDQELMLRPSELWDQPKNIELIRDDDLDDRASLPWEELRLLASINPGIKAPTTLGSTGHKGQTPA